MRPLRDGEDNSIGVPRRIEIRSDTAEDGEVAFVLDCRGNVIENQAKAEAWPTGFPVIFLVEEYISFYGYLSSYIDILDIGYVLPDGTVEPPETDFRLHILHTWVQDYYRAITGTYLHLLPESAQDLARYRSCGWPVNGGVHHYVGLKDAVETAINALPKPPVTQPPEESTPGVWVVRGNP